MSHARGQRRRFLLTLLADGGAQLQEGSDSGPIVWASDTDPEFLEEMGGQEFLDENDIAETLEYLVDEGYLTDAEADRCEIDIETLEAGPDEEGEAEEGDEGEESEEFTDAEVIGEDAA